MKFELHFLRLQHNLLYCQIICHWHELGEEMNPNLKWIKRRNMILLRLSYPPLESHVWMPMQVHQVLYAQLPIMGQCQLSPVMCLIWKAPCTMYRQMLDCWMSTEYTWLLNWKQKQCCLFQRQSLQQSPKTKS